jgi:O-antigen ligase
LAVVVVAVSALIVGWLSAREDRAQLAILAVIPLGIVAIRFRALLWIVLWLVVAGLLSTAPGLRVNAGLSELTPERLAIALPLLFGTLLIARPGAWLRGAGAAGIWLVLFSVYYLLISALESPDFGDALRMFWHHYLTAFVLFALALSAAASEAPRRQVVRAATCVGGLIALTALVQFRTGWDFSWVPRASEWEARVTGTFESPPLLGAVLAMLIFLALHEAVHGNRLWRTLGAASSLLMLAAVFLTYTRGAWLSVLAGGAVLVAFSMRRRPAFALFLLVASLGCVVVVLQAVAAMNDPRLQSDSHAIGRLDTTLLSLQQFSQQPVFGFGPRPGAFFAATTGYGDWVSHNTFLTLLVGAGAVGFILYIVPLGVALSRAVSANRNRADTIWVFALASATAYLVNALDLDMHYFSYPHGLFWLCLGLIAAPYWRPAAAPAEQTADASRHSFGLPAARQST